METAKILIAIYARTPNNTYIRQRKLSKTFDYSKEASEAFDYYLGDWEPEHVSRIIIYGTQGELTKKLQVMDDKMRNIDYLKKCYKHLVRC